MWSHKCLRPPLGRSDKLQGLVVVCARVKQIKCERKKWSVDLTKEVPGHQESSQRKNGLMHDGLYLSSLFFTHKKQNHPLPSKGGKGKRLNTKSIKLRLNKILRPEARKAIVSIQGRSHSGKIDTCRSIEDTHTHAYVNAYARKKHQSEICGGSGQAHPTGTMGKPVGPTGIKRYTRPAQHPPAGHKREDWHQHHPKKALA